MALASSMTVDAKALHDQFAAIKKGMSTATLRRAVRAGGKVVQKKAAQNAPVANARARKRVTFKDGSKKKRLSKSIRVVNQKGARGATGTVKVDIGWLRSAFHGNMIHAGAKSATYGPSKLAFKMPKGGKYPFVRGRITVPRRPPDKFLQRAFNSEKSRANQEIRRVLDQAQQRAVASS